jgi:toxin ParE1/3/4
MIQRWPEAAPRATDLPDDIVVRRAPVRAFPYRLVYLRTATALRVLAVAHDAREPGYWTGRIPNP